MEKAEAKLLVDTVPVKSKLEKLFKRHEKLERQVESIERYVSYSASAALHQRKLKKEKLHLKEAIRAMLNQSSNELKASP